MTRLMPRTSSLFSALTGLGEIPSSAEASCGGVRRLRPDFRHHLLQQHGRGRKRNAPQTKEMGDESWEVRVSFHDYVRGSSVLPDAMVICLERGCVCLARPSGHRAKPGPYVTSLTGQRPGGEEGSALGRRQVHPKTAKSDSKTWVEASPENRGGYLLSTPPCVSAAERTFLTQVTSRQMGGGNRPHSCAGPGLFLSRGFTDPAGGTGDPGSCPGGSHGLA